MQLDCTSAVSFRNLDLVREHLHGLLGPHELVTRDRSGVVDFWHKSASFGQFSFNEFSYGRDVATSAQLSTDFYIIIFTISGHISVQHRSRNFVTDADTVFVMTHDRFTGGVSADCRQLVVRVGAAPIHRYMQQYYDIRIEAPLEFALVPCSINEQTPGLHQMVAMICNTLSREDMSFNDARIRGSIEQALIGVLLHEIPHNYHRAMSVNPRRVMPRCIRLAKDYIHAHARERISVHEIATVANLSPRALQAGFRRYLNETPLTYLRNVRLDLAYAELTLAGAGELNVTEVAMRCGMTDLSRFAQYYRQRFGQHPSSTLRFDRH